MSDEKENCYFSCASINDLQGNNEAEVIDINGISSKNQSNNFIAKENSMIPLHEMIDQENAEYKNDPCISIVDVNLFNKKEKNLPLANEKETEFTIEENNVIKPQVTSINSNDSVHIVSFPSVQSFQENETNIPTCENKEVFVNSNKKYLCRNNTNQVHKIEEAEEIFYKSQNMIIIEELQEKKDYNGTSYRLYQILKYNKQTKDFETKCERRFDNFDSFYSKINRKYPYVILPKLSKKNVFIKIISNDSFSQRRQKQLCFLLNYIYSNKSLAILPEISYFIDSIEFKEDYYKSTSDDFIWDLHIKNNAINKLKSSVYSYFQLPGEIDDKFSQINKIYEFYNKIAKAVEKIKNEIGILGKLSIETAKSYSNLGSDLSFIREVKTINKEEMKLFEDTLKKMSQNKQPVFNSLYDKFDNFGLLIQGVVEMFERYNIFMKRFKIIGETYQDYLKNTSNYSCNISTIKDNAEVKKTQFEKQIYASIDLFVHQYGTRFSKLIHDYKELIFIENKDELNQLKTVN